MRIRHRDEHRELWLIQLLDHRYWCDLPLVKIDVLTRDHRSTTRIIVSTNKPTKRSRRRQSCERIASWTITGYQPALGLTDFPTSSVFCLHVRFLTWSDWNYMGWSVVYWPAWEMHYNNLSLVLGLGLGYEFHNGPTKKCSLVDINSWINVTWNNISSC